MKKMVIKNGKRMVISSALVFMTASVILKLGKKIDEWLIRSILWTFSSTLAYIIRIYQYSNTKKESSNIINFETKKKANDKIKWQVIFWETVFVTVVVGIIYAFIIGVLLEAKGWNNIVFQMTMIFALSYFSYYYFINE